jgi:hypothetical protein
MSGDPAYEEKCDRQLRNYGSDIKETGTHSSSLFAFYEKRFNIFKCFLKKFINYRYVGADFLEPKNFIG